MGKPAASTEMDVKVVFDGTTKQLAYFYTSGGKKFPASGDIRVGGQPPTSFKWKCPQEFEFYIQEYTPLPPGHQSPNSRSHVFMRGMWGGESPSQGGDLYISSTFNAVTQEHEVPLVLDANRAGEYKYCLRVKQVDGTYVIDDPRIIVD